MPAQMPASPSLTPEQFKALAKYKGWKYTMLAQRWGYSAVWISRVARDPNRPARFDDMLQGLPDLNRLSRDLARRDRLLQAAMQSTASTSIASAPQIKVLPGLRYRGYLVVGAIVTAATEVGSIAEEGMRGIVFQVIGVGQEEHYGVIFESGLWDWFPPEYVDAYLAGTGLTASGAETYRYQDEAALQNDFEAGRFDFWPP